MRVYVLRGEKKTRNGIDDLTTRKLRDHRDLSCTVIFGFGNGVRVTRRFHSYWSAGRDRQRVL